MNRFLIFLSSILFFSCSCKTVLDLPQDSTEKVLFLGFQAPIEETHRYIPLSDQEMISQYFAQSILSSSKRVIQYTPQPQENIFTMSLKQKMLLLDKTQSDYLYGGDLFLWGDSIILLNLMEVKRFPYSERVVSIPLIQNKENTALSLEHPKIENSDEKEDHFRTIIIDPGHGGLDSGVEGPNGINEAELNLQFSIMLKEKLETQGYNVELIHQGNLDQEDIYYPKERAEFANKKNPDLFISIHHDFSPRKEDRGFSIFYTSFKPNLDKKDVFITIEGKKYPYISQRRIGRGSELIYLDNKKKKSTRNLPWYIYFDDYVKDDTPSRNAFLSFQFALLFYYETVKRGNLPESTILEGYPIRDRDYAILRFSNTPSILVEMGHMSNPDDLDLIMDQEQNKIWVDLFATSVNNYFSMIKKD